MPNEKMTRPKEIIDFCLKPLNLDVKSSGYELAYARLEHVIKTYTDAFFKNINHRWTLLTFFVPLKVSVAGFEDPFAELAAVEETKAFIRELLPKLKVP